MSIDRSEFATNCLATAGAIQDGLNPRGQGFARPAGCGLPAVLTVLADPHVEVVGLPVIDGGPAGGSLGLIHGPIIGLNKCVDKLFRAGI